MSWKPEDIIKRTSGEEFNGGKKIETATFIYTKCEYCNEEIICVKDEARTSPYGYLGNQAEIAKNYLSSPSVEAMRKYFDVGWEEFGVERRGNGLTFKQSLGNNLYNVHSKLHVRKKGSRKLVPPWKFASGDAYKILCNRCFKKTYSRQSIDVRGGYVFEITVLPDETLEEVIEQAGIPFIDKRLGFDPTI